MNMRTPSVPRWPAIAAIIALAAGLALAAEKSEPRPAEAAGIFSVEQVDKRPMLLFQARPQYPFAMRKARRGGEVMVEFVVTTSGNVAEAHAIRSSDPEFEKSAVDAVSKWRFKPALRNGQAVAVRMQTPIVYSLN